jgi:Fe-S-cluster-containing dehydrogenase component|tara:strand:- start:458 stop:1267 length:810 start_codon:yes stop_codon:yes gene_type:complete
MAAKTFRIEAEKCTGCMLCVIVCKDEHVGSAYAPWTRPQPDTGQFWIAVRALERGRIPRVRVSYLPLMCQHCANAPCAKACSEGAIATRPDGLVWIDPAKCTNCGLCKDACPYGVIFINAELGVAQKCTGCAHRVDAGELPRCADVCPHEAIVFAEDANGEAAEIFHPEFLTEPRVRWQGLPKPWIAGTVIDAAADEVIEGAVVSALDLVEEQTVSGESDAFGDFWLRGLEAGRKYRLEIRKPGYEKTLAIVTTDGDQDRGTVALKKAP